MHTQATLQSMKRYRIGITEEQWKNMTPPIQCGIYQVQKNKVANSLSSNALITLEDEAQDSNIDCDNSSDKSNTNFSIQIRPRHRLPHGRDNVVECKNTELDFTHKDRAVPRSRSRASFVADTVQKDIDADTAKYPSLNFDTQRDIAVRFRALHQRVKDEGFYECRFVEYSKEAVRYSALFALFVFTLRRGWYFVSACFLGLFWHQIMFTAHDAGHRGITRNITADTLIGIFVADFCCGLSIGWWKSSHNVHHLVTNAPEHDPDIQNIPLFATAPAFLETIKSTYYDGFEFVWDAVAAVAVRVQKYTYYPVMAFARFNLYILSWGYLLSSRARNKGMMWWTQPTEVVGISCYFFLYFYVLLWCNIPTWTSRGIFLLTSHLITMPLHVQITLSHWGTSTSDLGPGESFPQRQLRTTMDISCPQWLDFIHGGLQFQAVHHLFPRVPRHNLRKLQGLVQEYCAETEIEYMIYGFVAGNGVVLSKLQQVAEQAKIIAACQQHMAATGDSGLH